MNESGVDPKVRVLAADSLEGASDTLAAIAAGTLSAALVRGVYSSELVEHFVARLERGEFPADFRIRDVPDASVSQIRTLGLAVSPSDLAPRGPDLDAYHAAAVDFRERADGFFAPAPAFPDVAQRVLAALSGVPVKLATDERGRPYGALTIRNMPPGSGLPPHCENHYMHIPVYDALRERVQLAQKIGFFCVLQLPTAGGRFVVYDDAYRPGEFAFQTRSLDIVPDRSCVVVPALPGDMVILASGARYHQVTRVEGQRGRWSVGGFGAFASDMTSFYSWA